MLRNVLKNLRVSADMTQQELADKLGIAQRTVAFYEKGERHPDYETLIKIADIFNCSIDYLLGRTNDKNEVLRAPTNDEALVTLAKNAKVPKEMIKQYIDYLKSQQNK